MHGAAYIQDDIQEARFMKYYGQFKATYASFLFRAKTSGMEMRVRPDSMPNDSYSREIQRN
jgi:hypothetical protein